MIIKKRYETKIKPTSPEETPVAEVSVKKEPEVELFDLDNIDFSQRQERRRGDRRRGYRRIDDRNLVSRAQEEAGEIKDAAALEGYKAGLEQVKEDLQQIKNALVDFSKAKQEVFEYIAPDILEISIDIARKIVKKEIAQDPQIVLDSILEVLKTISRDETKIVIKVNPSQVTLAKENMPEIISSLGMDIKTNVIGDDTISTGGCVVQTNNGIVDATVETQLAIIKEAFKGM